MEPGKSDNQNGGMGNVQLGQDMTSGGGGNPGNGAGGVVNPADVSGGGAVTGGTDAAHMTDSTINATGATFQDAGVAGAEQTSATSVSGSTMASGDNAVKAEPATTVPTDASQPIGAPNNPLTMTSNAGQATARVSGEKAKFWETIRRTFTKPITMVREDLPQYSKAKNAGIMVVIVLVLSLVMSLITTIISTVFNYSCSLFSSKCSFSVDFDLLEYVNFGKLVWNSLASTAVAMLVVAGIFFGIAQLFKYKKANFWKVLTVVSLSALPMIAISLVSTIVGIFSIFYGMGIMLIGMLCAVVVFYEGITAEAQAEGDKKAYYVVLSSIVSVVALMVVTWLIGDKIGLEVLSTIMSL